jgi:DNA-binding transcriptional LysR family regulator
LLPPVLRTFSATYPRVEIQVVGRPSHELALQIKDNTLDLACITRTRGCPGEFIRMEPMVWVGSAANRPIWKVRPLPIAVFAEGSVARDNAIKALQGAGIPYRMSYESPSIQGLVSMVDAGLAIAPLARCGVPAHLIQPGRGRGLASAGRTGNGPGSQHTVQQATLRLSCRTDFPGVAVLMARRGTIYSSLPGK